MKQYIRTKHHRESLSKECNAAAAASSTSLDLQHTLDYCCLVTFTSIYSIAFIIILPAADDEAERARGFKSGDQLEQTILQNEAEVWFRWLLDHCSCIILSPFSLQQCPQQRKNVAMKICFVPFDFDSMRVFFKGGSNFELRKYTTGLNYFLFFLLISEVSAAHVLILLSWLMY